MYAILMSPRILKQGQVGSQVTDSQEEAGGARLSSQCEGSRPLRSREAVRLMPGLCPSRGSGLPALLNVFGALSWKICCTAARAEHVDKCVMQRQKSNTRNF